MSELESFSNLLENEISYDSITETDLFLENCSSLYNLILDAIHDLSSKTLTCQRLEEMSAAVAEAGRRLVIDNPDVEGVVSLRINTITSALEQLRLRKGPISDSESCSSRTHGSSEIRNWIHNIEKRLNEHETTLKLKKNYLPAMTKLLSDQQVLQLEIQTEGQSHITRLYHFLKSEGDPTSDHYGRKKSKTDAIRKKWHTIYLNSLSLQFRIEDLLNKAQEDSDSESDEELQAPPSKRARRDSTTRSEVTAEDEDDTLPFAESEYESIMDGRATVTSVSSDESPARVRKWESVQQDIGYSSGENSVHEALNSLVDNQTPIRSYLNSSRMYYHMAMDDVSDAEVRKNMELKLTDDNLQNQLSESMHVNYDQNNTTMNLPEYDEVMALLDEEEGRVKRSESFNTQWKEIHGETPRKAKQEVPDAAKHSCDASSEDSSDWEEPALPDIMSRSYNSALMGGSTLSLKRHRPSSKKASQLLDCSEMEASFSSTRSDLPPCLGRSLRKKLRVRRMPRSMSDGEQLGVKSGLLTPQIRISPPRTPLSSSTKLLQELDRQLLASESDTPFEHSDDAPTYEWDDYKPPEKDDSMPDEMSSSHPKTSDSILIEDDDFGYHFPASENVRRLAEESRAHLKVTEKFVENGDIDARQVENIELICRTNLRQLDTAIKTSIHSNISDLRDLRQQWSRLLHTVSSPATQLLHKIGRFGESLRDLHTSNPAAVLNTMAQIKSKEDAHAALDAIVTIHKRLSGERDELRSLLESAIFRSELPEISGEFGVISEGYDDAVEKIDNLVGTLKKLNSDWADWNSMQKDIRHCMASIEERLKSSNFDQIAVLDQMEFCQERMNSLETMCNYLTATLNSIQDDETKIAPDFKAEISLYANALQQLRSRFNEMARVPTPPTPSTTVIPPLPISPIATSTPQKLLKRVKTRQTQTRCASPAPEPKQSIGSRLYRAVSSSWMIKGLLALSLVTAIAALFFTTVYGVNFGPHLTYTRGPPPM